MTWRPHTFSLKALRADAKQFLCLCIMVLALPFLHPLAEARAAQNGLSDIICTQFGTVSEAGQTLPVGDADDCPCIILCGNMAAGKGFKALSPALAEPLSGGLRGIHPRDAAAPDAVRPNLLSGECGIRGPPLSI